ncbi:MAG: hypothetical protein K0R98_688 [Rickettsiaceae bacterium]|jgi:hypothetical protein|nr:hypothetical protein [Rickettsiaceae bacterium]
MIDYFASLTFDGVTGVTRCNTTAILSNFNGSSIPDIVTPIEVLKSNRCNKPQQDYHSVLHPVTPKTNAGVTIQTRETTVVTHVTPVTPENNEELLYLINERAAIIEFDAGYSMEEAERLAHCDAEI